MDETPRDVAERFINAVGAQDAQAMLDDETLESAVRSAREAGWDVSDPAEAVSRLFGPVVASMLGQVDIETVAVQDDEARVTYTHPKYGRDADDVFFLRHVDGRWAIHLPTSR